MTPLAPAYPAYVISDVHLNVGDPQTLRLFLEFLQHDGFQAKTLVILGDLFDAWIGDDAADNLAHQVASVLRRRHEQGTQIYFVPGNRDFLMGQAYCMTAGMKWVEEPVVLVGTDQATALIHGDRLCTDDHRYQRFREKTQNPRWRARVLQLPVWVRRLMRRWARWQSQRHGSRQQKHSPQIMDINAQTVAEFAQAYGVERLIHGHTHRLGMHPATSPATPERWVLGDWHAGQGSYMAVKPEGCALYTLSLNAQMHLTQARLEPPPTH